MKIYLAVLFFMVEIALSGCSNTKPYPQPMQQANSCMTVHPDSALSYLSTLKDKIRQEPEETQMYYHLLTIKAEDKLYITHTSDSLINTIVQFYKNYGDKDKLMEAYFYQGSVYRDIKDASQAIKAFQQSVEVGQDTKQYALLGQAYGQMGKLFLYQSLYDESLEITKKAQHYYLLGKEENRMPLYLRDIAYIYDAKGNKDSALYYYKEAQALAFKLKDKEKINSILGELGCFYYGRGKTDTAKVILLASAKRNNRMSNVLLHLGLIYKDANQTDSARYYFNEILKDGNIYKQRSAYQYLSHLEADKKNYSVALMYAYQSQELMDSIDAITQTEAVKKIQTLYNYQHTEQENYLLMQENENYQHRIYILMLFLIILLISGYCIVIHIKRKKQVAIEQEKRLRLLKEQQYTQSLSYIEDTNLKIKELESQLVDTTKHNDTLNQQILLAKKELLELSNRQNIVSHNTQELLETTFKQSKIYVLFHKASNDEQKVVEEDWQKLRSAIDSTYHQFTDRLYSLYPSLSMQEMRICYLIKISFSNKAMANLLGRTDSAITQARKRLYKKVQGEAGLGEDFDKIIADL